MLGVAVVAMNLGNVDRASEARARVEASLKQMVRQAGLPYPPRQLFFRAFKTEKKLEIWGAPSAKSPLKLIKIYPVLAASGTVGPKRKVGDRQVPEGLYFVDRFNPLSRFHLSLGLNYPNSSDQILKAAEDPGCDIFIHVNAVSIGCLAMGDPAIEEIFTLARASQNKIHVLILPGLKNPDPKLDFWKQIYAINAQFEKSKMLPKASIDASGNYRVKA